MASKKQKHPKVPNKQHSKIVFFTAIFVLLIMTAAAAFFVTKYFAEHPKSTNEFSANSSNNTISDTPTAPDALVENIESGAKQVEINPQTPAQYDGENPNNADVITGAITSAGILEGELIINVAIDQYLSGNCNFTLTNSNSTPILVSAELTTGPTSAFCSYRGPAPASAGHWDITVKVIGSDQRTGTIIGGMEL